MLALVWWCTPFLGRSNPGNKGGADEDGLMDHFVSVKALLEHALHMHKQAITNVWLQTEPINLWLCRLQTVAITPIPYLLQVLCLLPLVFYQVNLITNHLHPQLKIKKHIKLGTSLH